MMGSLLLLVGVFEHRAKSPKLVLLSIILKDVKKYKGNFCCFQQIGKKRGKPATVRLDFMELFA